MLKDRYLQEHTRDICPGCQLWVPWYQDNKGKLVYSCQIGKIPRNDECDHLSKRRR